MAVNQEAFAAGHFEVAFHALMAALHAAGDQDDEAAIETVRQTAADQDAQLTARAPPHRLSGRVAAEHGGRGVFETAVTHADALLARVRAGKALADARRRHGPPAAREHPLRGNDE
jgi:hypothetical protein